MSSLKYYLHSFYFIFFVFLKAYNTVVPEMDVFINMYRHIKTYVHVVCVCACVWCDVILVLCETKFVGVSKNCTWTTQPNSSQFTTAEVYQHSK